jgi:hypothetical protein
MTRRQLFTRALGSIGAAALAPLARLLPESWQPRPYTYRPDPFWDEALERLGYTAGERQAIADGEALLPLIEVGEHPLALHVRVLREGVDVTEGMWTWVDEANGLACRLETAQESRVLVGRSKVVEHGDFRLELQANAPAWARKQYEALRLGRRA